MPFKSTLTKTDLDVIKSLALKGEKLRTIALAVNNKVSYQRIQQLLKSFGIDSFNIRRKQNEAELNEKMFKKWGSKWNNKEHRKSLIYQTMREKFRKKKANATKTGAEFTVDFGELTFPTHCPILGIELDYFAENRAENTVSFDRIDSNKGYISGNVVVVSWRANRIKNDGTADEHQKIADFLYQF
jgi:hypothetical protein